ncbi:MAG: hypothetical protein ACJ74O_12560, partial [Frankiaceae bacterium]
MTAAPHPPAIGAAAAAAVLLGLAAAGQPALLVGCVAAQLVLVVALVRLLGMPAPAGAMAIAGAAAVAADVLVAVGDRSADGRVSRVAPIATVIAVAFLAALLHQLLRTERTRVTDALAATVGATALGVVAAGYVALRTEPGGREVVVAALLGVVAALAASALADALDRGRVARRWSPGAGRGLAGVAAGLLAAAA